MVDRQYGQWMHIWSELTNTVDKNILDKIVGKKGIDGVTDGLSISNKKTLNIPLHFYFNRIVNSLPLKLFQLMIFT